MDRYWGEAFVVNRQAQIANPGAALKEDGTAQGLEPGTTEQVMERYRRGQAQTRTQGVPDVINVQIGSD